MKEEKIRIVVVENSKDPEIREVENKLEVFQSIVGGYIETLRAPRDRIYVVNEEGLFTCQFNRYVPVNESDYPISGNFFVTNEDSEGNFASLGLLEAHYWVKILR